MSNQAGSEWIWLNKEFARKCSVSYRTLARWREQGVMNRSTRKRVKLKARRIGGCWVTTQEWYDSFDGKLNGE